MKDTYHHGNLRAALLDAASQLIREHGVEGVSMRALSERIGVSKSASYRHFDSKAALLATVAERGFRTLEEQLEVAEGTAGPLQELRRFQEMCVTYVRFATAHPPRYRLMFGLTTPQRASVPALEAASTAPFELFEERLGTCQQAGIVRDDTAASSLAQGVWSTVHGLALLMMDGQLPAEDPDDVVPHTARMLWQGLRPR